MNLGRTIAMCGALKAVAFAAILLGGPASAQGTQEARGAALMERHCAICHAIGRAGTSRHAEAPEFRFLGRKYPVESLEEALAEGLLTGHPEMPEFKFAPRDVGAIVSYLQSIQVQ